MVINADAPAAGTPIDICYRFEHGFSTIGNIVYLNKEHLKRVVNVLIYDSQMYEILSSDWSTSSSPQ